jgi:hypothetical protein
MDGYSRLCIQELKLNVPKRSADARGYFMETRNAHKTGTSALQAFLHQNHELLRDRGVWYEPVAGHTNHTPIAKALQKPGSPGPRLITANLEAAHKHGCGLCLLSSEAFVEHPFEIASSHLW